jgi:hypothetical protein
MRFILLASLGEIVNVNYFRNHSTRDNRDASKNNELNGKNHFHASVEA